MRRFAVLCALALVVAWQLPVRAQPKPYEINVIVGLTGQAAFIAKQDVATLQTLEQLVNKQGGIDGTPIRFVFHDDQNNPQVSVQLANQLVAQNVPIIMGPILTATCRAVTPLVLQHGPVLYCLTPGMQPAPGGYQFSANVSTRDLVTAMFAYLVRHGVHRIATLTSTDATGQDADQEIAEAEKRPANAGVALVDLEHFNDADVTVAAQIARIKAANPEVLIAWATGPPIGTVFSNIMQAGLDVPVMTTSSNQTYDMMKQYAPVLPHELLFASMIYSSGELQPKNRAALEAFYAACRSMGIKPDLQAGFAWDPGLIVIDALRHVGLGATAEQLHAYIEGLHGFAGISGIYDFRDGGNRGVSAADAFVMRWDPSVQRWTIVR